MDRGGGGERFIVLTGDEKCRAMFSKEFYQKNFVAVVYDEVHMLWVIFFSGNF